MVKHTTQHRRRGLHRHSVSGIRLLLTGRETKLRACVSVEIRKIGIGVQHGPPHLPAPEHLHARSITWWHNEAEGTENTRSFDEAGRRKGCDKGHQRYPSGITKLMMQTTDGPTPWPYVT